MSDDARVQWFAELMRAGLEEEIFAPAHVLEHVTPEVLARNIPPELLSQVLSSALSASSMTPDGVLETLEAEGLARHIPHDVLWSCVTAAVEQSAIADSDRKG